MRGILKSTGRSLFALSGTIKRMKAASVSRHLTGSSFTHRSAACDGRRMLRSI
jgi:hypothetical protein